MAPKQSEKKVDCSQKYTEDFSNRTVVLGKIVKYTFFNKYKFHFKNWFKKQSLIKFVQINEVGYPRLVRMFFANLQMNKKGTTLTSRVNDVYVVVNPSVLAEIYGIEESGLKHYHTHKEISVEGVDLDEEVKKFTIKEEISKKLPDASELALEFRILHHMITFILLPRAGGRNNVSYLDLYVMWAIANEKKLNFPFMMFHHMNDVLKRKCTSLPYGMALTKLFKHFKIKLDDETETQTVKPTDYYNEGTLHRFGYVLEDNQWVPKCKSKRAIAEREVDEENDQSHLKKRTRRTEASTSVEIIALLEEMRTDIQTLKANQPIAASQPCRTEASTSAKITALLEEMRTDIQTLKANESIASSLNEMGADINIIKVRVDAVQKELQARDSGAVKMMEELKQEIKRCSQSQQKMTVKLENLITAIKFGVEMLKPAQKMSQCSGANR